MFKYRQSSWSLTPGFSGSWGQWGPKVVACRVSFQSGCFWGGVNLKSPTGGDANGIPMKALTILPASVMILLCGGSFSNDLKIATTHPFQNPLLHPSCRPPLPPILTLDDIKKYVIYYKLRQKHITRWFSRRKINKFILLHCISSMLNRRAMK